MACGLRQKKMNQKKFEHLKAMMAEIYDLRHAQAVLGWDQQTYMPPGGAESRGNALATLANIEHERWMAPQLEETCAALEAEAGSLDPDSDEAAYLWAVRRNLDKHIRVPARWISEFARVTTLGQEAWVKARKANDFASFRPHLERIVELRREYATFFAPYDHVYDPLLDDFEPGMKTAEVQAIFNELRPEQVALIQAIAGRPQVESDFLHLDYPEEKQWAFGAEVIKRFGYDFDHGRVDKAAHPFSSSFGQGDVRITTRVIPNYLPSMLFGNMHECGHALYDMGINPQYERSPLYEGASMAVHESQSRMWENLVGRSPAFWRFFYPRLQEIFPQQLGNVSLDAFYKGINRVQPSLIRVEADEATYNLHIMLRLELEIALMEDSLAVQDLPEAWNQRMHAYLGITPPSDADGVMQDIHWSGGLIGYFPTYALGNLVSAQLWEKIQTAIPGLETQIERGEFGALLGWLRENVHRYGSKYKPQDLIRRVTGETINPRPYLRYLKTKYSAIYGI